MRRHRKQKLPLEPFSATITSLSHDGRGIAHIQGKTTFIREGLPNEDVRFIYEARRSQFDEGKTVEVLKPSSTRAQPQCAHFSICGGCSLQHMHSAFQLEVKQKTLLEQLHHFGGLTPETVLPPLTGPLWGYRRKARLAVKYVHPKKTVLVGFREKNGRYIAQLEQCPVLFPEVGIRLQTLSALIQGLKAYQHIPQIEVTQAENAVALVFRHLVTLEESDQQQLVAFGEQHNFDIYLQPGGLETIHRIWPNAEAAWLRYTLPEYQLELLFHPKDFVQINAELNRSMVKQALQWLAPTSDDRVLDLFCGLGNFTLPLARLCKHVVGVEGDREMVERARMNAAHNHISNTTFYSANLAGTFLRESWATQNFDKILLDPPRTGALDIVKHLPKLGASRIVYVSCNPATLARDAKELTQHGYRLMQAGIMDMFPHTTHVESIAIFDKS